MARVSKATFIAGFLSLVLSAAGSAESKADTLPIAPPAPNPTACTAEWHAAAEKVAALGQALATSDRSAAVPLWRLLMLGDTTGSDYGAGAQGWSWDWDFNKRLAQLGLKPGRQVEHANYTYAVQLFDERVKLLGADHPYVRDWMLNQLDVFQAGTGGAERPYLRGQYEGAVQALAADDLRYQLAATDFYAGALDTARTAFTDISNDATSRHRLAARYMLARLYADANDGPATLNEIDSVERDPAFADIRILDRQLLGVLSWNGSLDSLEGRRLMLIDGAYLQQPRSDLQGETALRQAYDQALADLRYFIGAGTGYAWNSAAFEDAIAQAPQIGSVDGRQALDLLVWLAHMDIAETWGTSPWLRYHDNNLITGVERDETAAVYQHVIAAEGFEKLAWTITFAMRAVPGIDHADLVGTTRDELARRMADCSAGVAEQAAYGALRYHDLRLHLMTADADWLKTHLTAALLADGEMVPGSDHHNEAARYLTAMGHGALIVPLVHEIDDPALRLMLAQTASDLAQALALAQQASAGLSVSIAAFLNVLPVETLQKVVDDPAMPSELAGPVTRMAWLRAYLLGNQTALVRLTPALTRTNPQLKPWIDEYRSAWTIGGRRLAILKMLLRTPRMSTHLSELTLLPRYATNDAKADDLFAIDKHNPNDDSWWCSAKPDQDMEQLGRDLYDANLMRDSGVNSYWPQPGLEVENFHASLQPALAAARADYLANQPLLRGINRRELDALSQVPMASTYLGRQVTAWVRQRSWLHRLLHGNEDDEMADALARVVRITRWGCTRDGSPMVMSSRAYGLLHQLFPDSAAAEATPYWYDSLPPDGQ